GRFARRGTPGGRGGRRHRERRSGLGRRRGRGRPADPPRPVRATPDPAPADIGPRLLETGARGVVRPAARPVNGPRTVGYSLAVTNGTTRRRGAQHRSPSRAERARGRTDTAAEPFDFTFDHPDLSAGSELRHAFAHAFAGLGEATSDAELVLSELYANAVIHG